MSSDSKRSPDDPKHEHSSTADDAVELLMKNGMDGAAGAMVLERNAYLVAGHYEQHSDRVSYHDNSV